MTSQQTQEEANKAIIRRYHEAHNTNNMGALDDIVAADLISHNSFPGLPPGVKVARWRTRASWLPPPMAGRRARISGPLARAHPHAAR